MSQGKGLTPDEKAKFIQKLKLTGGNVSAACKAVKRSRNALYENKKTDADFSAAWDEACESVYDSMEQEMYRRAVKGVTKPLIFKGQIVKDDDGNPIMIREYSDRLLEFALKGNRPEKFRDRLDVNQTVQGALDVNIESEIDKLYGDEPDNSESVTGDAATD